MRVVSPDEMKKIEEAAIELGLQESLIIENIGLSAATFVEEKILNTKKMGEVILLVGRGNNGADGLAIGRHLANRGHPVRAFMLFGKEECGHELKNQAKMARSFGVKVNDGSGGEHIASYFSHSSEQHVVIDAILGLGARFPLPSALLEVINVINTSGHHIVSIDLPTGVCAATGAVNGGAIEADHTLTIGAPKTGLFLGRGAKFVGQMEILDGGLPRHLLEGGDKHLLTPTIVQKFPGKRNKWAHKNTFGHTLLVGGSPGLTGALVMASTAALKVGTGLVTASTWKESYHELCGRLAPEVMTGPIPTDREDIDHIIKTLESWNSIVIGPGLGRSHDCRKAVTTLLNHFAGPVVVDADAIRVLNLKEDASLMAQRKWPTVLTPHMGEFAHFVGVPKERLLENPLKFLKQGVDRCHCCLVVKGTSTYIGFPNGKIYINHFPNDGMATGGSGDVLAGILGGLLAQYPLEQGPTSFFADTSVVFNAILFGVMVHTLAGRHAATKWTSRAMTAGNLIDHLPDAFFELDPP